MFLLSAYPDIGPTLTRELAYQEDQAADALSQRTVRLADLDDALVDFTQKHAGVDHFWGKGLEQLVARHNGPKRSPRDLLDGVVTDSKLRAQLAVGAGSVDLPEAVLPESTTHWQQWIVLDDDCAVFDDLGDAGALQLSRDLAGVRIENLADVAHRCRLLLKENLAGNLLDFSVRQWHADRKAIHQLLQQRYVSKRALPCSHDHDLAIELLGDGLGYFGYQDRPIIGFADILLNLVQDEKRARGTTVAAAKLERLLDRGEELFCGDVACQGRIARPECLPRLRFARSIAAIASQERLREGAADIQVVQVLGESLARRFDRGLHLVEVPLRMEPQTKSCLRILLRQFDRTQEDAEDREPHLVRGSARQGARRSKKPARSTTCRIEFTQQFAKFIRHRRND